MSPALRAIVASLIFGSAATLSAPTPLDDGLGYEAFHHGLAEWQGLFLSRPSSPAHQAATSHSSDLSSIHFAASSAHHLGGDWAARFSPRPFDHSEPDTRSLEERRGSSAAHSRGSSGSTSLSTVQRVQRFDQLISSPPSRRGAEEIASGFASSPVGATFEATDRAPHNEGSFSALARRLKVRAPGPSRLPDAEVAAADSERRRNILKLRKRAKAKHAANATQVLKTMTPSSPGREATDAEKIRAFQVMEKRRKQYLYRKKHLPPAELEDAKRQASKLYSLKGTSDAHIIILAKAQEQRLSSKAAHQRGRRSLLKPQGSDQQSVASSTAVAGSH